MVDHCTLAALFRTLTAEQAILNSGSTSRLGLKRGRDNDSTAASRAHDEEVHAEAGVLHYLKNGTPVVEGQPADVAALARVWRGLRAERARTSSCGWCCACLQLKGSTQCLRALHEMRAQKGEQGSKWAAMGELLIGAACEVRCFWLVAAPFSIMEYSGHGHLPQPTVPSYSRACNHGVLAGRGGWTHSRGCGMLV